MTFPFSGIIRIIDSVPGKILKKVILQYNKLV